MFLNTSYSSLFAKWHGLTSWIVNTLAVQGDTASLFSKNTLIVSATSPCSRCSSIASSSWSNIRANSFISCLLCRLYILFTAPGSSNLHQSTMSPLKPSIWKIKRKKNFSIVISSLPESILSNILRYSITFGNFIYKI